jgi:hypothetical protein
MEGDLSGRHDGCRPAPHVPAIGRVDPSGLALHRPKGTTMNHLQINHATSTLLADVQITPNKDGLPGVNAALRIVGALLTFGLIAAVAGIAIGAMVWAVGSHTSNPHHASRGKAGVLVSAGAAILVGSAVGIVNFFSHTAVS